MRQFLEWIEIREAAGRDLPDMRRTQISQLTVQLEVAEKALERLHPGDRLGDHPRTLPVASPPALVLPPQPTSRSD